MKFVFKYILLSLIISTFALCENDVFAQLSYHDSNPIAGTDLNPSQNSVFSPSPRRGFKKRRYGRHTFALEGGYFYGYYEGLRYSINYDLLAQSSENNALTIRLGFGVNKATNDSTYKGNENYVPIGINILIGRKNDLEIGGGVYYYLNRKKTYPLFFSWIQTSKSKRGFYV